MGFGDVADAHQGGDAADPLDVGLEDIDQSFAGCQGKGMYGVPVLAGGENLSGHPLADFEIAVHIFGQDVVFQPFETVGSERFNEANGVLHVERHPGVEHDFDVVADLLAGAGDEIFCLANAVDARFGAVAGEEFDGFETEFEEPVDAIFGAVRQVCVAGVAEDFVFLRAAQKFVHRALEDLSFQVPQGIVHGADSVAGQACGVVGGRGAAHQVPALFRGHAVLSDQQGGEVIVYEAGDRIAVDGHPEAPGAVFRGDHAGHARPAGAPISAFEFGIAFHGVDKALGRHFGHSGLSGLLRRKVDGYGADVFDFHSGFSSGFRNYGFAIASGI